MQPSDTAYPRFKSRPSPAELERFYTPTQEEQAYGALAARAPTTRLGFVLLLKSFQRLGYFVVSSQIPQVIVEHIATAIGRRIDREDLHRYDESQACCGQSRIDPRADDGLTQAKSPQSQCWQRFARLVHGSAESRHVGQKWIGANSRQSKESQDVFARKVGVPLRTYKRFEANGKASLETFVQILRAIERTQYLFMLFPQPVLATARPPLDERLRQLTPTKFK